MTDAVVLNFHLPNCDCVEHDGGRVTLSEACADWSRIMHRWHDDAVKQAADRALAEVERRLRDERRRDPVYDVWPRVSEVVANCRAEFKEPK